MEQLEKAAQKMSKKLNADVVVVQTQKKPFSFRNPLPSTAGLNKSLKKAKTSLTKLSNAAIDWTNQRINMSKLSSSLKNVRTFRLDYVKRFLDEKIWEGTTLVVGYKRKGHFSQKRGWI